MSSRWQRLKAAPERGGGRASVPTILLVPVALLVFFLGIQVAVYHHARSLALHAAQTGVLAGRTEPVSAQRAQDRAAAFLRRAASDFLTDTTITATTGDVVRVTVTGRTISLVPGIELSVSQTSAGGLERPAP
jgi:Flp pilus assembly protein TadG